MRGLSELNPALSQYGESVNQSDQRKQHAMRESLAAEARAQASAADFNAKSAVEWAGQPLPSHVPPALGQFFGETYRAALGARAGNDLKNQAIVSYNDQKDKPDFDAGTWLAQERSKAMQGFGTDPIMADKVGGALNDLEVQVRGDTERRRVIQLTDTRDATVNQNFSDALRPDMSPAQLADTYMTSLRPQARALGMSNKDATGVLARQLLTLSDRMGGNPALFDVFDVKDSEGLSLLSRNPELAPQILSARQHAKATQDRGLMQDAQQRNFKTLTQLEQRMASDPSSITPELIQSHMGQFSPFPTDDAALGFWNKAQTALRSQKDTTALQANWDGRTMWMLKPDDQAKVMEANLGPTMSALTAAVQKGDNQTVTANAEQLARAQSAVGAKAPLASLQQFIDTTVTSLPGKTPSPAFEAAASIYRAYSADPTFRDLYFNGDVGDVMKAYVAGVGSGDKQAAYESAYRAIAPESRAAAEKLVSTEEFRKKSASLVNAVQGSSFWPQWAGGNGRPENATTVQAVASSAVRDWYAKNPNSSEKDAAAFAQSWVEQNFVNDTTTSTAVRVPPEFAGKLTQEAISENSKRVTDAFRATLSSADAGNWKVNYWPDGNTGQFMVVMQNGTAVKQIGRTTIPAMQASYRETREFSSAEMADLSKVNQQLRTGSVDPAFLASHGDLLDKARRVGVTGFGPQDFGRMDKLRSDEMLKRLQSMPSISMGTPDQSSLQFIPQRGGKVDNKLTASVAQRFLTSGIPGGGNTSQSLTGSLITMAEGVVLARYPDPAKEAGDNIGMGYNLKANAAQAPDDLKRAGVPHEDIQAIIAGQKQLLPEQAQRLLQVAMPRYESQAMKSAEATAPGLWARMSPGQKAVMTDIAYQVGSTDKFHKAWAAIAKNDSAAFQESVMTTYVDRTGVRQNDTRRWNLRASMLAGLPSWNATVAKYGGFPSNAMDSVALNTK